MAVPTVSHIKLKAGTVSGNSTIYTNSLITIGDTIRVSGTVKNNGVFTVTDITTNSTDVYYILKGTPIVDEDSGGDPEIEVVGRPGDKLCAIGEADAAGGIDVWSNNATTTYTNKDEGWNAKAINPTISGDNAKYIFHFADEALRVCNSNEQNSGKIKWYGYIERQQFSSANSSSASVGLVFSEWQEHPNDLGSPKATGILSYAYGTASHSGSTASNYYQNARGVAKPKQSDVSGSNLDLRLNGSHDASTTSFIFENNNGSTNVLDQSRIGEVVTIDEALGTAPKEFLFCKTISGAAGGAPTYQRAYGGALAGTAPDTYADTDTPILERGLGFNIGVDAGTAEGQWQSGEYEFYQSFIYDGIQESIPVKMSNGAASIAPFTHTVGDLESMQVSVYADLAYNGRVTGGRIYTRLHDTSDDLILLVDIDIEKGVRTTPVGGHVAWTLEAGKGFYVLGEATGNSIRPNIDTYDTLNGFSPDVGFVGIGGIGELYKTSVIANRRAFIANVRTKGKSGKVEKFGDRIMYSELNKFDTFLDSNFIDVSKGDYGEYTAIESYADRLLAFKHNLVHIINIASPSAYNWYLENTFKYYGVNKPYSVTRTNNGVAWVSVDGVYLYDGSSIRNLLESRIAVSNSSYTVGFQTWQRWYQQGISDPMIGYDSISNSLIIVASPTDSFGGCNTGFIYDFDTNAWIYHDKVFTDDEHITNFISDWNNNLTVGINVTGDTSDVNFKKFLPVQSDKTSQVFVTRDIDFGQPGLIKKIYKVMVTYKSSVSQTTPFKYSIDGKQNFAGDGGGTFTGNFADTSDKWDVLTLTPSSTISCQSIQLKFEHPSSGSFEFNDITIQYRVIRGKEVT